MIYLVGLIEIVLNLLGGQNTELAIGRAHMGRKKLSISAMHQKGRCENRLVAELVL